MGYHDGDDTRFTKQPRLVRELIRTTQIDKDCKVCKGEGYVPAKPRYEICPKCKNNKQ